MNPSTKFNKHQPTQNFVQLCSCAGTSLAQQWPPQKPLNPRQEDDISRTLKLKPDSTRNPVLRLANLQLSFSRCTPTRRLKLPIPMKLCLSDTREKPQPSWGSRHSWLGLGLWGLGCRILWLPALVQVHRIKPRAESASCRFSFCVLSSLGI